MAALLLAGTVAAIDKIKEKRAGKRRSTATSTIQGPSPPSTVEPTSPRTPSHDAPTLSPPSFSTTTLHHDLGRPSTAAQQKERMRLEDAAAAVREGELHPAMRASFEDAPAYEHPVNDNCDAVSTAPPAYEAPPYERHRSDTLLESSQQNRDRSHRSSRGLFPRAHTLSSPVTASMATDMAASSIPESSAQAREAERQGLKKCSVDANGRCACGKRERSPGAPLGETVKERRDRKWKEQFNVKSEGFWGLVGVSLASHGGTGRWWDDEKQFRYWNQ